MRLFVGLDLPPTIKETLAAMIERLRPLAPDAKWVPRDNLHLTFSFLGEVAEERIATIESALAGAAGSQRGPIATALDGSGAFPSPRRARVLWVGLADPDEQLSALARVVAEALEPVGFPREKRPWTAHLTLARFRVPGNATDLVAQRPPEGAFDVKDVTLFRSRLARPAPRYEPLRRFPLAG